MLAFGHEKVWSKFVMMSTALNFLLLFPLVYLMWPPAGVAVTGTIVDVFVAMATYGYYRRNAAPRIAPVPA
jgi:hypothetical protein